MSSQSFCDPKVVTGDWKSGKSGRRSINSLTWSLLKTIHCSKLFPDALYFKLLHFLATIRHSLSNRWASYYFFPSAKPPPIASLVSKWTSGSFGCVSLLFFYKKSFKQLLEINHSDTQPRKNPQFPMVHMLFNKQPVYAKNTFLKRKRTLRICHFKNFFFGNFIIKITYEAQERKSKKQEELQLHNNPPYPTCTRITKYDQLY